MVYRVIGLMSGSSLDGLDLAFVELHESAGNWTYEIITADTYAYTPEWVEKLRKATQLNARDYQLLHTAYGRYTGELVNVFIEKNSLLYKVQLIASHGHTTFHLPGQHTTAQLGDGAAIAAVTGINVVSDLRALDVALGGQGAPIVPMAEKLLLKGYAFFLNIGGIANLSYNHPGKYIAFDICPANRVLNELSNKLNKPFDEGGQLAAAGTVQAKVLDVLNSLEYYDLPFPRSLANDFGTDVVLPLLEKGRNSVPDSLRTYVEHIAIQVQRALEMVLQQYPPASTPNALLVTGGGAHNHFLAQRLTALLQPLQVAVTVPDKNLVDYKEAIAMALIGVLRWREQNNVLASVTGASRNSIGGAVWIGQDA